MPNDFALRPYAPADCPALAALFYDTVHTVAAADYTPAQLDAWADGAPDLAAWDASFRAHRTLVAVEARRSSALPTLRRRKATSTAFMYTRTASAAAWRPRCARRWRLPARRRASQPTPRARRGRFSNAAATACCAPRPWCAAVWRLKTL